MKVFFGDALEEMLRELRGQGVPNVRLHVLPEVHEDRLILCMHVTTFCNNQIYEALLRTEESLAEVSDQERRAFIRNAAEQARQKVAEQLEGLEIRRGILQQ
jgi:hypothetical protein